MFVSSTKYFLIPSREQSVQLVFLLPGCLLRECAVKVERSALQHAGSFMALMLVSELRALLLRPLNVKGTTKISFKQEPKTDFSTPED